MVEPVDTVDTVETVETVKTVDGLDVDVDVDVEAPATLVGKARSFVEANPMAGYPLLGIAGFMGVTFVIAVVKTFAKSNFTSDGKRRKKINANKLVIDELQKYLPENRSALKGSAIAGIRLRTGFRYVGSSSTGWIFLFARHLLLPTTHSLLPPLPRAVRRRFSASTCGTC